MRVTVRRVSHDHPGRSMAAGRQTCMALERSSEFTSRPRSMGWMRDFETSKPSPHHMPPLTRPLPDPCQSLTTGALVFKCMWSCGDHSHSPNRRTFAFWGVARKLRLGLTVFPKSSPSCPFPLKCWDYMYHYIPVPCGFFVLVVVCLFNTGSHFVAQVSPGSPRIGFVAYTGLEFSVVLVVWSSTYWDYNRHMPLLHWLFLFVCLVLGSWGDQTSVLFVKD